MTPDMPLSSWVVLAVAGAILTALGFLVRNAFDTTTKAVEGIGKKLDDMGIAFARADGDRRVLEQRVSANEREIADLRREMRELSEGVAR